MKMHKQESNTSCGIACLRSIFSHYGKELTEKEILDKNEFYKSGNNTANPMVTLGITALKLGFKVTCIGYNPIIANNIKDDLKSSLKEKAKTYYDYGKFQVEKTLEFIELDGNYIIERPTIEKIKKLIDENEFLIVEIRPAFVNYYALKGVASLTKLTE